jgi:predicted PurR-regulated permease PerM
MPPTITRLNAIGWLAFLGLLGLFIALGLLKFLVFLLFMHLVVDLMIQAFGDRVPFVSRRAVLYGVYALVAVVITLLATVIAPSYVAELPAYRQALEKSLGDRVTDLLASWNISLNIPDLETRAIEWGRDHVGESLDFARRVGTNVVLLLIAFIITFLVERDRISGSRENKAPRDQGNLWLFLAGFVQDKISAFYGFFRQVMAGQVVISAINAALTVILLVVLGIPSKLALTVMVFLFGLLPVVGNLISNTLICISALLWGGLSQMIVALIFLVVIHKLEYFLNSKIIGNIVHLPVYMTLLGLIVGEALFQISGMILSIPVILFVRAELSAVKLEAAAREAGASAGHS